MVLIYQKFFLINGSNKFYLAGQNVKNLTKYQNWVLVMGQGIVLSSDPYIQVWLLLIYQFKYKSQGGRLQHVNMQHC